MDPFISPVTDEEVRKEKLRARTLKKTQWWKRKCAEGTCYFCSRKMHSRELTMEHVVPIIRGGKSTKGNVVPACKSCNSKKKYLLPLEWDDYLQSLKKDAWS
jgi:5-methylcytosine-specific restriction endonuclease McrA